MSRISIKINPEKCRGCRRCELACSWTVDGFSNPALAGIRIDKLEDKGKDYPVLNQQCEEKFCGKIHPWQDPNDQIPRCVASCLFGALRMSQGGDCFE